MSLHSPDAPPGRSVTCVIPTHGRPDDLAGALASVLAQTRLPEAVVVVDDLGDPRTRQVVEAAADSGVDVRLLPHPHGTGASSSRNRGARAATTSSVAFLDDDDVWRPRFLARTMACAGDTGADLVLAGIERLRLDGLRQSIVAPAELTVAQLMARNPGITGANLLVDRQAFLRTGGFDERLRVFNDWDFLITCLTGGLRYAVVPELLVEWREHAGERLSTLSVRRAEGIETFLAKHEHRMSGSQRAELRAAAQGIRRRTSPSLIGRAVATLRLGQARGWRRPDRSPASTSAGGLEVRGRLLFPQSRDGLGGSVITGALLARDLLASDRWSATAVVNGEGLVADYHRGLGLPTVLLDDLGRSRHTVRPADGNRLQRAAKRVRIAYGAEQYLRRQRVDLVHVSDESSALGWGVAAKRRGVPVVWHVHQQLPQRIDALLLRLSAHVVFVADANRTRFGTAALRVPNTTIYNTVDTDVFSPGRRSTAGTGPVRLAFVSNLVARKRPDWAVRAGAQLLQEGCDVEVVVVGADFSGQAVAELSSSAAGRRLGERLQCAGRSDDVPAVLRGVDLLLLPSMRDREAFPRVVVEAMSCGIPVVATAVAGVPEAVVDEVTGRLVDPDDFDAFCDAVRSLVEDRNLRERMGAAGRARALEIFAARSSLGRFEQIYAGLLNRSGGPVAPGSGQTRHR